MYAARNLGADPRIEVTIVDRRNFHLFQPLLYQVATGALGPSEITQPPRSMLGRRMNTTVLLGEAVASIPTGARSGCRTATRSAMTPSSSRPGPARRTSVTTSGLVMLRSLKSIDNAMEIRRRILIAFEAAEREADPARRAEWMTFVVVGGGPTGVDLAGALGEIANDTLRREFRSIDPAQARIHLVEALDRILSVYPADRSGEARHQLERRGVTVQTGTRVVHVDGTSVGLAIGTREERLPNRTVLWAAGARVSGFTSAVAIATEAETDRAGRIVVEGDRPVSDVYLDR